MADSSIVECSEGGRCFKLSLIQHNNMAIKKANKYIFFVAGCLIFFYCTFTTLWRYTAELNLNQRLIDSAFSNDGNICKYLAVQDIVSILKTKTTENEWMLFDNLITNFMKVATEIKLDYMLAYGTLLGSYRHHGFIPWDDDFDLLVNVSHMSMLENALVKREEFMLVKRYGKYTGEFIFHWKLSHPNGTCVAECQKR